MSGPFFVCSPFIFYSFTRLSIVLILNNLEVFMKRFFLGTFLAASLFAIVACSSSTGSESTSDECLEDPNLPICQVPDGGLDDGSDAGLDE